MKSDAAISVQNVSKCFRRYATPRERLKEVLWPGHSGGEDFWALQNINLEVQRGETLGIVGQNGSGKSTLLQIIAGTLQASSGTVKTHGRISALLELGSGFNPEFTGRQNVYFNGQILGLSRSKLEAKFATIEAFAEIGKFMDEPVKTYSSGMFVRLAFAVAINVDPEILIVDEALAVGDGVFVHRCMAKIKDFQDQGGTILFVSHETGSVARLCSRAIWLNQGQIVELDQPSTVCRHYQAWMHAEINKSMQVQADEASAIAGKLTSASLSGAKGANGTQPDLAAPNIDQLVHSQINPFTQNPYCAFLTHERFGTGRGEIESVRVLNQAGEPLGLVYPGEVVRVLVRTKRYASVRKPNVGIALLDRLRTVLSGWSTELIQDDFDQCWLTQVPEGDAIVELEFLWPPVMSNSYSLDLAFADGTQNSKEMLDWVQNAATIQSATKDWVHGIFETQGRRAQIIAG
jgi:lipopolysaccharide transport system ATP-binding protein